MWDVVLFSSMKINQWKALSLQYTKNFNTPANNSATNYSLLTIGTELSACILITFLHVILRNKTWFDPNQRISFSYKVRSSDGCKKEIIIFFFLKKKKYIYISINIDWINVWKKIRPERDLNPRPRTLVGCDDHYTIRTTMLATRQSTMWFTWYGTRYPGKFSFYVTG